MKAVDTNVLARFILNDDPTQSPIARQVIAEGIFISHTVLLEIAWLLGSRYQLTRLEIIGALKNLYAMPNVTVADEAGVAWAIARFADGADIADMIHLLSSQGLAVFATFDGGVASKAGSTPPIAIETLA